MNRLGEVINGIEIIRYGKSVDIDVRFSDGTILKNVEYGNLKKGSIKNPFHPRVYGIGFIGIGNFDYVNNLTAYRTWNGMMKRCYDEKNFLKFPTYKDCSVHPDWHNYQNFAKWFYENYKDGFQMDKDLLFSGNKIYSAETCRFIPQDLNKIFTYKRKNDISIPIGVYKYKNKFRTSINKGNNHIYLGCFDSSDEAFKVYKKEKESYLKEQALKYKNDIKDDLFKSLMNYVVNP